MSKEWGPWIEHDGKHVPNVVGLYVGIECETLSGAVKYKEGIVTSKMMLLREGAWVWAKRWIAPDCAVQVIIRYRVRKPRGLAILERIAANSKREKVDA